MRVQTWLNQGWPTEIIIAATKAVVGRKHGPPPESVQYFEKAIAAEIARQAAPVPTVVINPTETIHVQTRNARGGSLIAAIDAELARSIEEDRRLAGDESPVLSLPARSIQ
jgi:hypothetical protein